MDPDDLSRECVEKYLHVSPCLFWGLSWSGRSCCLAGQRVQDTRMVPGLVITRVVHLCRGQHQLPSSCRSLPDTSAVRQQNEGCYWTADDSVLPAAQRARQQHKALHPPDNSAAEQVPRLHQPPAWHILFDVFASRYCEQTAHVLIEKGMTAGTAVSL